MRLYNSVITILAFLISGMMIFSHMQTLYHPPNLATLFIAK